MKHEFSLGARHNVCALCGVRLTKRRSNLNAECPGGPGTHGLVLVLIAAAKERAHEDAIAAVFKLLEDRAAALAPDTRAAQELRALSHRLPHVDPIAGVDHLGDHHG